MSDTDQPSTTEGLVDEGHILRLREMITKTSSLGPMETRLNGATSDYRYCSPWIKIVQASDIYQPTRPTIVSKWPGLEGIGKTIDLLCDEISMISKGDFDIELRQTIDWRNYIGAHVQFRFVSESDAVLFTGILLHR